MKNVVKSIAKISLILSGLTAAASSADAGIHKKVWGSGIATLIISNDKINMIEIVKFLQEFGLLLKGVNETIKNEAKEQKVSFLFMLLGTLGASFLGTILAGKVMNRAVEGCNRAG